jgi:hypothetical protein
MFGDLGVRLKRAGLVTRARLADAMATVPHHAAALVRALIDRGTDEDALAGFFVAEGFGPVAAPEDLNLFSAQTLAHVSRTALVEFGALPVRPSRGGWVFAMLAPSDRHVVQELERLSKERVLPIALRLSDLDRTLRAHAIARPRQRSKTAPVDEQPPVLELVRRRSTMPTGKDSIDEPAPMPLVRTKRVAMSTPPFGMYTARGDGPGNSPSDSRVRPPRVAKLTPLELATAVASEAASHTFDPKQVRVATLPPPAFVSAPTQPMPPKPVSVLAPPLGLPEADDDARPAAEGSWDLPTIEPSDTKRSQRAQSRISRPGRDQVRTTLPDVRTALAAIRSARTRDDVVLAALDGSLAVSRCAVFFALRKNVLKGWAGVGSGVSQDAARNLWIPTTTASLFQRVVESGNAYLGPYGSAIADGIFRAAVGSRGGDVALQPIRVGGKIIGVLACDDVRRGMLGLARIEQIVLAVEDAFGRIIAEHKLG